MITPEKIKELAEQPRGNYELVLGEFQAIYTAAEKSPFYLISYAYAYGFHRGQKARKGRQHGKVS